MGRSGLLVMRAGMNIMALNSSWVPDVDDIWMDVMASERRAMSGMASASTVTIDDGKRGAEEMTACFMSLRFMPRTSSVGTSGGER